jgi:hypothetical protein
MSSQATASMSKPYCRVILILLTVACGVCAVVTAPIALLTAAMAFDAPDSDYQLWAWIVFFVILSIPLWFVIGAAAGWALYLQGWRRTSLVLAATPLGGANPIRITHSVLGERKATICRLTQIFYACRVVLRNSIAP